MRKVIGGNGADNTAATQAWLLATPNPIIRHLFLIGAPEDPRSIWLTDHEAPVIYQPYGTFQPSVIKRGQVTASIGLEVQTLQVTWAPNNTASTASMATASPLQLARLHVFDNWPVRIFRTFMPTPGDANTLGCCDWFGGRVKTTETSRGQLVFNVNSYLDVVTQKLPANVIEVTNTMAGYTAATAPPSSSIPVFDTFTGSSQNVIYGDCLSPTFGHVYDNGTFNEGYMIFLAGPGATLAGAWSAVGVSEKFTDGDSNEHNEFQLYALLPWPPTPGVDKFYVSSAAPINLGDESYYGFPWVPTPQTAV